MQMFPPIGGFEGVVVTLKAQPTAVFWTELTAIITLSRAQHACGATFLLLIEVCRTSLAESGVGHVQFLSEWLIPVWLLAAQNSEARCCWRIDTQHLHKIPTLLPSVCECWTLLMLTCSACWMNAHKYFIFVWVLCCSGWLYQWIPLFPPAVWIANCITH